MERYSQVDAEQDLHIELTDERPARLRQGSSVGLVWVGAAVLGVLVTIFIGDKAAPTEEVLLTDDPLEALPVFAYVPFEIGGPPQISNLPPKPAPIVEDIPVPVAAPTNTSSPAPQPLGRPSRSGRLRRQPSTSRGPLRPRAAVQTDPPTALSGRVSTTQEPELPDVDADPAEPLIPQ